MHHALPRRKHSTPSPYTPPSRQTLFNKFGLKRDTYGSAIIAYIALVIVFGLYWCLRGRKLSDQELLTTPGRAVPVVIVTVFDAKAPDTYLDVIRRNRIDYAKRHGYATFFAKDTDYNISGAPTSWARIPAMRHALTEYSQSTYIWFLHQDTLIMEMDLSLEKHVVDRHSLEKHMLKGISIVPHGSIIKTSKTLAAERVGAVLAQDEDSLIHDSLILRVGTWTQYLLDAWFDPLYRSYNFEKAELHALEHILQWHPLLAQRIAIVPQRIINAYSQAPRNAGVYEKGDFVVRLKGCEANSTPCLEALVQKHLGLPD